MKHFLLALTLAGLSLTAGAAPLPALGDGSELSSSAERRLGERIARELYRDPDYLDDAVLAEYVQAIWEPLLAAARARGELSPEIDERFAWQILLGRDRTVNAFALPGGYFGVHLGLLAVVGSRDELASVLGHELSHVTQRHISRLIAKQSQQAPWLLGAMILGTLAAAKNTDAANALIVGGQAVAAQSQLNFSRDMEREADRVGFSIATQAGFDAQGFVGMFDKLQQASRLNDSGAYPYLRSHPLTTERIADMQTRLALTDQPVSATAPLPEHAMLSARARVLSNPGVDALRALARDATGPALATQTLARQSGALYAAALASARLREFSAAYAYMARLDALLESDARARTQVRRLELEIALAAADAPRAQAALRALASGQTGRPERLLWAQTAVLTHSSELLREAASQLQTWVAEHAADALAWQWLAAVYSAQGQTLRAVRADAETQAARLDYAAALDRFKAAQDLLRQGRAANALQAAADDIDASIIDTRSRQVEKLLKEQTLER